MTGSLTCNKPGCNAHPSKGDAIFRISEKGAPFIGLCQKHLTEHWETKVPQVEEND